MNDAKEMAVGVAVESTFGTAIADSGTFTEVHTEPVPVELGLHKHDIPGAARTREPIFDNVHIVNVGSIPRFTVNGPLSVYECDQYAAAFFQDATEVATGTMTKTFVPFAAGSKPDFAADAGYFYTWLKQFPVASTSWKMASCICEKFHMSGERHGLVQLETGWAGIAPVTLTNNPNATATWERGLDGPGGSDARATNYGLKYLDQFSACTIAVDGGGTLDVALQSFDLNLEQTATEHEPDGSGGFSNWMITDLKGALELKCLKDATAQAFLAAVGSDAYGTIVLRWGAATAVVNLEMELTMSGTLEDIVINEDGLLTTDLKMILGASSASTNMITMIMSNTITRNGTGTSGAWPAP